MRDPVSQQDDARPRAGVRRVLLDTSFVMADPAPLGIHRVLAQYATYGARFAAQAGVGFDLVECTPDGGFTRRVAPLIGSPLEPPEPAPAVRLALRTSVEALRYGSRVLSAGGHFLASLVPAAPLKRASAAFSRRMDGLVPAVRAALTPAPIRGEAIAFAPGDVLFCPGFWHEMEFSAYRRASAAGAEIVFLVHDILPALLPNFYQYPWRLKFERALIQALALGGHFYAVSGQSLDDLRDFARWHGTQVHGSVAYNGFERGRDGQGASAPVLLSDARRAVLARRPWLMVGTVEPKKGHRDAVATFERLWREGYERPLVIIGRRGWMSEDMLEIICGSPWYGQRLFWYQDLGDAEVAAHYAGAHALLFASVAEGFGLPPLEAATRGLPVLARDIPVVRELLGAAGCYFSGRREMPGAVRALEDVAAYAAVQHRQAELTWYSAQAVVDQVMTDLLRPAPERAEGMDLLRSVTRLPVRTNAQ
ncbi:glycosyltransferase [Roseixanthobacter glucoisosaccharinicivorans]|uniref:glycosyltransferase n=1 Tax=Roseixanthobacter glucoisosaccharinicivorans TaxID=3119923 RepID=UPI00372BBA74